MVTNQDIIRALIDKHVNTQPDFHPGSPIGLLNSQMMNPTAVDPRLAQAAAIPVGDLTGIMQQAYSPQQLSSPVDWTKGSSPQMGMGDGNRVMNQIPGGWSSPQIPLEMLPSMTPTPGTNIR